MEEEASSWIRRTKFSHTIYHRLDPSKLASFPLPAERDRVTGLKSRPQPATSRPQPAISMPQPPSSSEKFSSDQKPVVTSYQIQRNPITNKPRSVSPMPQTVVSDVFKEAKSDRRRFSTPHPQRKQTERGFKGKFFHRDSLDAKAANSMSPSNSSPLRHLNSMKAYDKSKRKETAWTKYFDNGGGKVTAVETSEEWTVDLSKLFLGQKFAYGAHSRLYHGMYKEEPVAVKILRVPDDDENGTLAARLEKQFNREATLLPRLQHKNVIKVIW